MGNKLGRMLKHSYSLRIMFSKGSLFDIDGKEVTNSFENPVGNLVNIRIEKNKVTKPDRKIGFYTLSYEYGIDVVSDTVNLAIQLNLIVQGGSWFTVVDLETGELREDAKFQGKPKLIEWVNNNEEYFNALYEKINKDVL